MGLISDVIQQLVGIKVIMILMFLGLSVNLIILTYVVVTVKMAVKDMHKSLLTIYQVVMHKER